MYRCSITGSNIYCVDFGDLGYWNPDALEDITTLVGEDNIVILVNELNELDEVFNDYSIEVFDGE